MLIKQGVDISFAEGLDTKTDPKRVQVGKFLQLQNSVFLKGGLLQKRNGYASLTALPNSSYSYLTTFNGDLTAIGSNIAAYGIGSKQWVQKGSIQPVALSTLPLLRNNLNQVYADSAIASNGYICTAYIEQNGTTYTNKYVIADSVTGQNLVAPAAIPVGSGTVSGGMRVYFLDPFFIIVFTNMISATPHLQYVAFNASTFVQAGTNADISASYQLYSTDYISALPSNIMSWDAAVGSNGNLYIAYPTSVSTYAVYLSKTLALSSATDLGDTTDLNSVSVDSTGPTPVMYVWAVDSTTLCEFWSLDNNLNILTGPIHVTAMDPYVPNTSGIGTTNFGSVSFNGSSYAYFEIGGNGTRDPLKKFLVTISGTVAGVFSAAKVAVKGMCLASKPFAVNGAVYAMGIYDSTYQPTYFVIPITSTSATPVIAAKLAYQNGGGLLPYGLPNVRVSGSTASVPYLFKDLIQAVNKGTNLSSGTQTAGIYSQTGINLAYFNFTTADLDTAEIGNDLHLTGGFLWMYDGYLPVEHNFFLWPEGTTTSWTDTVLTPTGTASNASTTITLSSATGVAVGMSIADTTNPTYIPSGTIITALSGTTATMSLATTHAISGDTLAISGFMASKPDGSTYQSAYFYQVTYEWTDNQGNAFRSAPSIPIAVTTSNDSNTTGSVTLTIPTLRATLKSANPVKIVVYRWSVAQQNYYQTTSITRPVLNDTTVDFVKFVDVNSDATILGNNLIYTTGGVIEDVNAPASNLLTIFDSRLWLVDAEDTNLVWYSKQVIEATPVEMSDLLTIYVPPNTGTNISTGPITAISTMDDKVIFFKKNAIIYINGSGPDNTGSNSQYSPAIFITSTVGCANQYSVVLTPNGLMFQSDKGIWLLGRDLSTDYIGAPVENFTTGATVNSAVLIPGTNQVRFTMSSGITLMYDYYYGQWGTFIGVPAISSCIFQNLHTFINSIGQVYQESPGAYIDGSNPVEMMFQTGPINFGQLQAYERIYFFYLLGQYFSPHTLNVSLYYDYASSPSQSILVKPAQSPNPYGSQSPYGQGNPYGGTETVSGLPPEIEQWRIFPANQRCQAISIQVQEVFDPTFGTVAGAGLTLSGINAILGMKKPFRPQPAAISAG